MIQVLQEVTDWPYKGVYHVNNSGHLVAYQSTIYSPVEKYKKPIKIFSKSGRKFKLIKEYEEKITEDKNVIVVKGSKGNTYTITDGVCSCPGYTYRGDCKHVKENS